MPGGQRGIEVARILDPEVAEPRPDARLVDDSVAAMPLRQLDVGLERRLDEVGVGTGPGDADEDADVAALDDLVAAEAVRREVGAAGSPLAGRDAGEVLAELAPRVGPERLLDLMLRSGPYGLTLADLEAAPHGIDLGPLQPRLPEVLRTPSGTVELAPPVLVADVERLHAALAFAQEGAQALDHLRGVFGMLGDALQPLADALGSLGVAGKAV
jgi:hypothetical protein